MNLLTLLKKPPIPGALGMHVRDGMLVPCDCGGPTPPRTREELAGYPQIENGA